MLKRFIRAIKSMFGGVISSMENPKLILEQNIRELNDQIPQMNENIATVKANLIMLQKEVKRNEKQIVDLTSKIKSAIKANRDDIAEGYALQLEKAKETIIHSKDQLQFAERAYEKALKVKKVFMREKDRKIQEAKEALRASERAEWQSKIADTLEQFEVGGIDQTHDEMISRINEESAKNEARMEIALDSIDTQTMEIEANAEKIRAHELVEQFKLEMGESSGSISIDEEPEKEEAAPSKSVGNKEKS
ncbi:MAG: PspA/IM30 family protein [Balneolaceae bacterium]|nr:PspA/IM30 family protein [Balneolaceae bacterium]MBO6547649.1 PspA/IM30 family protein [Balneolaceae bacterium]MBO6648160.1 PspA/IM30 family protein [Balneolaceae bacterium]